MGFFKDFKADVTQAMNELIPGGNEVYDEDEIIDEIVEEQVVEPPKNAKKTKKSKRSRKSRKEQLAKERTIKEKDILPITQTEEENDKVKSLLTRSESKLSIEKVCEESSTSGDEMEIAPEDMSEQIDSLLDRELYGDEIEPQMLLDDDMEVDTMDMSVEELLNQLAMKQSVQTDRKENVLEDNESEDVPEESQDGSMSYADDADMGLEALLNSLEKRDSLDSNEELIEETSEPIDEKEEVVEETSEPIDEKEEMVEETSEPIDEKEEMVEETSEPIDEKEEMVEETSEPIDEKEELIEETGELLEDFVKGLEDEYINETTENETVSYTEENVLETNQPADAEIVELADEYVEAMDELEEVVEAEVEATLDDHTTKYEQEMSQEDPIEKNMEEEIMSQEKDVISINSVDDTKEEKAAKAVKEKVFNVDDVDAETTYITKGTKIKGDMETEGSIDIIGSVEGSVVCKGKVVVGGNVVGNITAGELYANGARIEGNIKSYGSVKVGVGTMIIGGIEGESAVIAGAVNGDIDVQGPVIVDSTAVIMGNIKSRSVQINNGAVIEGFCSQSYSDIDVKSFFE